MLYQLNTLMRLVGFVSRMVVGVVIGFVLGWLTAEGKIHIPHVQAATMMEVEPEVGTDGNFTVSHDGDTLLVYCGDTYLANSSSHPYVSGSLGDCDTEGDTVNLISIDSGALEPPADTDCAESYNTCVSDLDSELSPYALGTYLFGTPEEESTSTESTTTPDTLTRKDATFFFGVIIFLLAYPVWGRIFSKPRA